MRALSRSVQDTSLALGQGGVPNSWQTLRVSENP
jgi:hypothetical protein